MQQESGLVSDLVSGLVPVSDSGSVSDLVSGSAPELVPDSVPG